MADNSTKTQAPLTNHVELQQLEPQPVLSIRQTIKVADLSNTMGDAIPAVLGYLQQTGAQAAGPIFVRYHTFGDTETDLEIGIPVVAAAEGEGRIAPNSLPGGPAVTVWHVGAHDRLGEAYARLQTWPKEHDREPDGPPWEEYYWIDPRLSTDASIQADPATWRTRLVQPIK
jgi:effector-binding domain-containing protein